MTALDELKGQLVTEWDETDEKTKLAVWTEYNAMDIHDPEFHDKMNAWRRKYTNQQRELRHMTTSEIHAANVKAADAMIKNLVQRIEKKIGKITDYSGVCVNPDNDGFAIINGWFTGESGRCEVRSISAGGYNIQKRHVRVIIK